LVSVGFSDGTPLSGTSALAHQIIALGEESFAET
jgi:hypothetical protein